MPDAAIVSFANSLVAWLNAGAGQTSWPFCFTFQAALEWVAIVDRKDLDTLRVAIVPTSIDEQASGRQRVQETFGLFLVLQAPASESTPDKIGQLVYLQQQLRDALRFQTTIGDAAWQGASVPVLVSTDHLDRYGQFTSIVALSFSQLR